MSHRRRIVAVTPAPQYPRNVPVGDDGTASIALSVTFPAPDSEQVPTVTFDVARRVHGGPGIRIAKTLPVASPSFVDRTPASRVVYDYRIVARAANGQTTPGSWNSGDLTAPDTPGYSDIYGGAYHGAVLPLAPGPVSFESADFTSADFT